MKLMNYIQVKVAKAEIKFLKLHGTLKLQFHIKRKIIGIENEHREHISEFIKNNKTYIKASKRFLKKKFCGYHDVRWHKCYAAQNGIKEVNYIPEDVFKNIIQNSLNNQELMFAYKDKNLIQKLFPEVNTPETILRIIHGRYYNEEYNLIDHAEIESLFDPQERYVFKPSIESGGGNGIIVGKKSTIIDLIQKVMGKTNKVKHQNYIIQKYLEQHDSIKSFHPKSLNTIRIMTLRLGEEIHHISSVLRMGVNGSEVDNESSGGISSGIDKDGRLKQYAFDKCCNRYEVHSNSRLKFEGFQVPHYNDAVALCRKLHNELYHFNLISWDIAISSQSEINLIEYNIYDQGINLHQLNNGPLFGDLTDKVIASLSQLAVGKTSNHIFLIF